MTCSVSSTTTRLESQEAMSLRTSSDILVIENPGEEGSLGFQYAYDFLTGHKSLINKSVFLPKVVATTANASDPKIAKYFCKTPA